MKVSKESYNALGLMSGTSMDGLDLAYCRFERKAEYGWDYRIIKAATLPYSVSEKDALMKAIRMDGEALYRQHLEYGRALGAIARQFLDQHGLNVDVIGSHGHTIYHRPELGYSFQLGHGQSLALASGCPVVWDFRTPDVLLGGQGAPLVPAGDEMLFKEYDACVNLGGISNISLDVDGHRIAFDICPVNMVLNAIASRCGLNFDDNGFLASTGRVDGTLLEKLDGLDYYLLSPPKSLGREWVESRFMPLLGEGLGPADTLATITEHIAGQISAVIQQQQCRKVLFTGGGVYNGYLMERIRGATDAECILPSPELIEFKEAMIFGFMAVLRLRGENNVLASATGAARDHCAGLLSLP